jgi:hypothetical protein
MSLHAIARIAAGLVAHCKKPSTPDPFGSCLFIPPDLSFMLMRKGSGVASVSDATVFRASIVCKNRVD